MFNILKQHSIEKGYYFSNHNFEQYLHATNKLDINNKDIIDNIISIWYPNFPSYKIKELNIKENLIIALKTS